MIKLDREKKNKIKRHCGNLSKNLTAALREGYQQGGKPSHINAEEKIVFYCFGNTRNPWFKCIYTMKHRSQFSTFSVAVWGTCWEQSLLPTQGFQQS